MEGESARGRQLLWEDNLRRCQTIVYNSSAQGEKKGGGSQGNHGPGHPPGICIGGGTFSVKKKLGLKDYDVRVATKSRS